MKNVSHLFYVFKANRMINLSTNKQQVIQQFRRIK